MDVAVVTVGDELLAGDTVNTNAAWLGRRLTNRGVTVERVTVVPDRTVDIAAVVSEYAESYDAVVVTGGLGPTHDDVTMLGVAAAFDRDLEESEEALARLEDDGGYSHDDLAEGTAEIPAGARPLYNVEGVAPGCVLENVYVLPGVPEEMKAMFDLVAGEFTGRQRHVEYVIVDEPESALVDRLVELESIFDVKVGSYPGDGVRVKVTGDDEGTVEDALSWLAEHANVVANQR